MAALQRILSKGDQYFPVGVCIEALFFGLYTALFIAALWIWHRKRRSVARNPARGAFAEWLYLVLIVLMWFVALLHLCTSIQRFLRVFILELQEGGRPTSGLLLDATRWDNLAHMVLVTSMIWLGDILVLYRTYIVWHKKLWVISLPILIHVAYLVVNAISIYILSHPHTFSRKASYNWYYPVFPLVFVQNVMTTGLLSFKIWSQYRQSGKYGAVETGGTTINLGALAWLFIETAMVYTLELMAVIILGSLNHPSKGIAVVILVPTLGIVFVLFSIRVHFSGMPSSDGAAGATSSRFPSFRKNSACDPEGGREEIPQSQSIALVKVASQKSSGSGQLDRVLHLRHMKSESDFDDKAQDSLPSVMISRNDSQESF